MKPLNFVADENIPALDALFSDFGPIVKKAGRDMTADDVAGADVLLVRSVTKVNQALLAKSQVQFVGTCTIGTDHIDKAYLEGRGINWSAAPGCNAGGVVQYALAAMATYRPEWQTMTVGIIGCGNVGGRLYRTLKALGVRLKVADPYKTTREIPELASLDEVLDSDIICMHTPLTRTGEHPTLNLLNADNLSRVKSGALLVNAGRGEVIDNRALYRFLQTRDDVCVVLDVWQGEPDIYTPLLDFIKCGTPHIAGYSFEGKLNGSLMVFEALGKHLGLSDNDIEARIAKVRKDVLGESRALLASNINEAVLKTYNLQDDHALISKAVAANESMLTAFDKMRKSYWQRRELGHYFCAKGNGDVHQFLELVNGVN